MLYLLTRVFCLAVEAMNPSRAPIPEDGVLPLQPADQSAGPAAVAYRAQLEAMAQEWLRIAESGDLIPAWNVKEPPGGIPQSYLVGPPIIKPARTRCKFHSESERRALLLCTDIFGAFPREDTPRAQTRFTVLPGRVPLPAPPPPRPPVANIDVR